MKSKLLQLLSIITGALTVIMASFFTSCSNDEPAYSEEPEIWASSSEVEFDYNSNVTKTVKLYGDVYGYEVSPGADWLANSYIAYDELKISVTKNTSTSSRTGNLFVFNPNGGNSLTIKVTQLGKSNSGENNNGGNNEGNNGSTTKKLTTPTGVKVVNIGTPTKPVVQITWNGVPNATTYRVIKTYPKNGGYEIEGQSCSSVVLVDTSNEYAVDSQVEVGTAYEYKVMAAGSGYESSNWSAIARINL